MHDHYATRTQSGSAATLEQFTVFGFQPLGKRRQYFISHKYIIGVMSHIIALCRTTSDREEAWVAR